jgi:hypothetical protein
MDVSADDGEGPLASMVMSEGRFLNTHYGGGNWGVNVHGGGGGGIGKASKPGSINHGFVKESRRELPHIMHTVTYIDPEA